jgi:putative ABC transport system permease protein
MWLVSLRDLQWRRRRFAIAVLATAMVFGLALLLSGVSASFHAEVRRTVASFEADAWVVRRAAVGPVTAPVPFLADVAQAVASAPGVTRADPVLLSGSVVDVGGLQRVNVVGVTLGGLGAPVSEDGRRLTDSGQAIVDASLGVKVGDSVVLSGLHTTVVGLVHGITYFAGQAVVFIPLADAQRMVFSGQPLATAIVTKGRPSAVPTGFRALTNEEIQQDMVRPIAEAIQTVGFIRSLLWLVAAGIIGAIIYLTALERTRDFAVLKATGASTRSLLSGLMLQAIVLAVASAALSIGIERALQPAAAMSVEVPLLNLITLPLVAVVVGVLASLAALRRAVTVDPAMAFGG